MTEKNIEDDATLICFRSTVLLQDWITYNAFALEEKSWIMSRLAEDKYVRLTRHLIRSCITPGILKRVTTLIFDKAVLEPTFCAMYAQLCYDIHDRLPKFPPEPIGSDDDEITFMRVLLNTIQMLFDGTDELSDEIRKMNAADQKKDKEMLLKLRTLGNLRLVGELFLKQTIPEKIVLHFFQELLSHDEKTYPSEEKLEAVCVFLKTIGKKLDGSKLVDSFLGFSSKQYSDYFFRRLKSLSSHPQLSRRIKFLVRDIFDLRSNNWIPSGKESSYYPLDEHHM